MFPLFLLAINAGGLDAATGLPGFPTDSYLTFALAVPFIQAGIFAVSGAGADLARDIETGLPRPARAHADDAAPRWWRASSRAPSRSGVLQAVDVHRRRAGGGRDAGGRAWRARS